jgi:general secretion pathway protein G
MTKGFSLIELLLVMAIMAILSTLMLPNLLGAQDKARESGVRAVAHAIQLALESYSVDHGVYPAGTNLGVAALPAVRTASDESP